MHKCSLEHKEKYLPSDPSKISIFKMAAGRQIELKKGKLSHFSYN